MLHESRPDFLAEIIYLKENEDTLREYLGSELPFELKNINRSLLGKRMLLLLCSGRNEMVLEKVHPSWLAQFIAGDLRIIVEAFLYCLPDEYAHAVVHYLPREKFGKMDILQSRKMNSELTSWLRNKIERRFCLYNEGMLEMRTVGRLRKSSRKKFQDDPLLLGPSSIERGENGRK